MSRARWAHIFRDEPDRLHTAMSFEQVADEASFVLGPVLAVLVVDAVVPRGGAASSPSVLFTAGMLAFLVGAGDRAAGRAARRPPGGLAVRRPGLLVVATALVMTGVIFGANEVIAVAYAKEEGATSFSSVILGGFALGSTIAGIVFGTKVFTTTMTRRLRHRGRGDVRPRGAGPARRGAVAAGRRHVRRRVGHGADAHHEPVAGPAARPQGAGDRGHGGGDHRHPHRDLGGVGRRRLGDRGVGRPAGVRRAGRRGWLSRSSSSAGRR